MVRLSRSTFDHSDTPQSFQRLTARDPAATGLAQAGMIHFQPAKFGRGFEIFDLHD